MCKTKIWHSSLLLSSNSLGMAMLIGTLPPLQISVPLHSNASLTPVNFEQAYFLASTNEQGQTQQTARNGRRTQAVPGENSDLGKPDSRTGGSSRNPNSIVDNPCPNDIVALVPGEGEFRLFEGHECLEEELETLPLKAYLAYTSDNTPNVWVYIPTTYTNPDVASEANLALVDLDRQVQVDGWTIPLPSEEGIICMPLSYPLETNKIYRWQFEINVSGSDRSANPSVNGFVQYLQDVETDWYNDLNRLGTQLQTTPELSEVMAEWEQLLSSQGLGAIASMPVVSSCPIQEF